MHITVYSQELCPPCIALKQWLDRENIPYRNVYTKTLTQVERKWLREKILSVSKLDDPTVPAVQILNGEHELWVSNHGENDVTGMVDSIKKIISKT